MSGVLVSVVFVVGVGFLVILVAKSLISRLKEPHDARPGRGAQAAPPPMAPPPQPQPQPPQPPTTKPTTVASPSQTDPERPSPAGAPDPFAEVERKAHALRRRVAAAPLSDEELAARLGELLIEHKGVWWKLDHEAMAWYRLSANEWIPDDPPRGSFSGPAA